MPAQRNRIADRNAVIAVEGHRWRIGNVADAKLTGVGHTLQGTGQLLRICERGKGQDEQDKRDGFMHFVPPPCKATP